jgi:hypothetical protein
MLEIGARVDPSCGKPFAPPFAMLSFRNSILLLGTCLLGLASGPLISLRADAASNVPPTASSSVSQKNSVDAKISKILGSLKLGDPAKGERAKVILSGWLLTLTDWHQKNDSQLKELWAQWAQARSMVPKDEFPGEVIAHRIDDVYATLRPAYEEFIQKLSGELSPDEIDRFKEAWSRSPGMRRTYNAFLEIAPDLSDEQKQVVLSHMMRAREAAMLTDSDKEIINIYKRHKVKVEAYIGSLEWAKLHRAYAKRSK